MRLKSLPDRKPINPPESDPVYQCDICNETIYEYDNYFYDDKNNLNICSNDDCLAVWAQEELIRKKAPTIKKLKEEEKLLEAGL